MRSFVSALAVAAVAALSASQADAAIINVYTGVGAGELRADWEAAVGAFTLEDFSDGVWQGVTVNMVGGGHGPGITAGHFHDVVAVGTSTEFDFGTPISAFGGDWDLAGPGGQGIGIIINAGGVILPIEIPNTHNGLFFGFVSDTPFTIVGLTGGTQALGVETFFMDDAVFAAAAPEPATMLLLGLGAAGAVIRRRRQ